MKAIDRSDALRSIKRYIGKILDGIDPDFDVQFARAEPNPRPSATVQAIGPSGPTGGSAYVRHLQQSYTIFVYPLGVEGNALASKLEAERIADLLETMLSSGAYEGFAKRVPVYDHAGVDWDADVDEIATPPYDFAPMTNLAVAVVQDAGQDDMYNITVDCRLHWEAAGDVRRFQGQPLTDVRTRYDKTT